MITIWLIVISTVIVCHWNYQDRGKSPPDLKGIPGAVFKQCYIYQSLFALEKSFYGIIYHLSSFYYQ